MPPSDKSSVCSLTDESGEKFGEFMSKSSPGGRKDDISSWCETSKRLDILELGTIIGLDNDKDASKPFAEPPELSLLRGENISATVGLDDFDFGDERLIEGGVEELGMSN